MNPNLVGKTIKKLRLQKMMTQHELASHLNVAVSTISNWEIGRRLPSFSDIQRIAQFFGVSMNVFELDSEMIQQTSDIKTVTDGNQIIDFRPLGYELKPIDSILLITAMFLLFVSVILRVPIAYSFLILGMALATYVFFRLLKVKFHIKYRNYKRLFMPSEQKIVYVFDEEENQVQKISKRIIVLSIASIALVCFNYLGILHIVSIFENFGLTIVISLYALLSIAVSLHRHKVIVVNRTIKNEIDYYSIFKDLKYDGIEMLFSLDLIGTIAFVFILVLNKHAFANHSWLLVVVLLSIMNSITSFKFLEIYKRFLSKLTIR